VVGLGTRVNIRFGWLGTALFNSYYSHHHDVKLPLN
jgi:hypothetical protein